MVNAELSNYKKGLRKLRPSLFRLLFREKASEYFCGPFYNLTAAV